MFWPLQPALRASSDPALPHRDAVLRAGGVPHELPGQRGGGAGPRTCQHGARMNAGEQVVW